MLVIEGTNVNDLYYRGFYKLREIGVLNNSRNGPVLVASHPVMSVYHNPWERVLFDRNRDANPFFHLMEAIWMFAGRSDAAFLNQFVKDFGSRFAEDDGILWGAYGWRWRQHFMTIEGDDDAEYFPLNQIDYCVQALRKNPDDRRVVISMWDPGSDLGADKKDLPCNTQLYPRVVGDHLDLTIMCRSNDIIWGAYGANAVHFSFLQEAMAAGIGVPVGKMYQLSNNWHGYVDLMNKKAPQNGINPYDAPGIAALPLVDDYDSFFEECQLFCQEPRDAVMWNNSFFLTTAAPMYQTHKTYREHGARAALQTVKEIGAPDWRIACDEWLERRIK